MKASNVCRARLEDAKQKVEVLVKDSAGGLQLEELDEEASEGDEDEATTSDELPF